MRWDGPETARVKQLEEEVARFRKLQGNLAELDEELRTEGALHPVLALRQFAFEAQFLIWSFDCKEQGKT